TGNKAGVLVNGGNVTITDSGTISGTTYAIHFTGGGTDRLILHARAVINGTVSAGGATSTLELAKSPTTGTVSGLGTKFAGFATITEDKGATWAVSGSTNKIANTTKLTVNGTMSVSGSLIDHGPLTLNGTLKTSGTGTIQLAGGAVMHAGSRL